MFISWLPDMLSIDGVWVEVLKRLYEVFSRDFKQNKIYLNRTEVWYDRRVLDGKHEEAFWHLITRDDSKTSDRLFDPRRAERLPWCAPVISNSTDQNVRFWRYKEGNGKIHFYIWLFAHDYVVVLEERRLRIGSVAFLITAFYVDGPQNRATLERKYLNRVT